MSLFLLLGIVILKGAGRVPRRKFDLAFNSCMRVGKVVGCRV